MNSLATAVARAETELSDAAAAMSIGNMGRARVSARRGVGAFLQTVAAALPTDPGPHAMANLRWVQLHPELPDEIRAAAARLLGGPRNIARGEQASDNPINDARMVIEYFQQTLPDCSTQC
ncbi:MAG: hypothetical protein IPM61_09765 [Chlorobi bacterium]|nr:hypothetical protein [Chlorobiota bacterium]